MLLASIVSTLLGLTLLVVISFPFFNRKRDEFPYNRKKSKVQELRMLCYSAQSEIDTLELELGLGYLDQDEFERRVTQYRSTRDELFSRLNLLESQFSGEENKTS